jgi:hypothetical protein
MDSFHSSSAHARRYQWILLWFIVFAQTNAADIACHCLPHAFSLLLYEVGVRMQRVEILFRVVA